MMIRSLKQQKPLPEPEAAFIEYIHGRIALHDSLYHGKCL